MAEKAHRLNQEINHPFDPRLEQVLDILIKMASGEFDARLAPGEARDEIDGIMAGINMMAEELEARVIELHELQNHLELQVQQRTRQLSHKVTALQTLAEIDRMIIRKSETHSVLTLVCRQTAMLLKVPKTLLVMNSKPGQIAASLGLRKSSHFFNNNVLLPQDGLAADDQLSPGPISYFDQKNVANLLESEFLAAEKIRTAAVAPLPSGKEVLGYLLALDTKKRRWSKDDAELLAMLAGQTAIALEGARLFDEERTRREELGSLYDLSRALADVDPQTEAILSLVARHTAHAVNVTFVLVLLVTDGKLLIRAAYPMRIVNRSLYDEFREPGTAAFLQGVMQHDSPVVIKPDSLSLTTAEKSELFLDIAKHMCIVPLYSAKASLGLILLGEARQESREPFSAEKIRLAKGIGDQTVSALRRAELFQELEKAYLETVLSLANAVDAKDSYTGDHGRLMAKIALTLGRHLGMDDAELNDLHYGALLHDIGKIGVPDTVLNKPGRLTDEEWLYIHQHPSIGENILTPASSLRGAAKIVRHHHERYDGGGYPDRLAGEAIPLGARILNVADSFCAMVDKRVYKQAQTVDAAIIELKSCSGSQFDPRIVGIFLELWEKRNIVYEAGPTEAG